MTDISPSNFEARLAVLEERTAPKPKTIFDRIKDWAGILTFVIAVLYTYPLGVWDRFVVTTQEKRSKEIAELRSLILKLAEVDTEYLRGYSGTSDVQVRASLSQLATARKAALLTPNVALIEKQHPVLTGAELELIGYQLNQLGDQGLLVDKLFTQATEKMVAAKNIIGAADTYRIHAGLYGPFGSLGTDLKKSREYLQKAMTLVLTTDPSRSQQQAVAVVMDWINYEAVAGSWPCAEQMSKWLIAQFQCSNPAYAQSLQAQFNQLATFRKSGTLSWIPASSDACSPEIVPWTMTGWPLIPVIK